MSRFSSCSAALIILAASATAGCNTVDGKVDGMTVPVRGGFFVQEKGGAGDDDLLIVFATNVERPCDTTGELMDALDDADDADEAADAWAELLPEDFWEVRIVMRLDDVNRNLSGVTLSGVSWDEGLSEDGEAYAGITHYSGHVTEDVFMGQDTADVETWFSDGGDLKINQHTPGDRIQGNFETFAADPHDGAEAGVIRVRFDGQRCHEVEREMF